MSGFLALVILLPTVVGGLVIWFCVVIFKDSSKRRRDQAAKAVQRAREAEETERAVLELLHSDQRCPFRVECVLDGRELEINILYPN